MLANSLLLPGARDALRFLFYPDFSKLTATSVIEALGHSLYTVGLGLGAMIAYGSYLKKDVHIPSEAVFVVTIDTILSLCAGILIFPIVFTAHSDPDTGAKLLFKTMPVLFGQLSFGYWLGLAFFICLYFSALSGSITIYEGLVAYLTDKKKVFKTRSNLFGWCDFIYFGNRLSIQRKFVQEYSMGGSRHD
jgi:NSS family neurotransmitter:Na+ symporter